MSDNQVSPNKSGDFEFGIPILHGVDELTPENLITIVGPYLQAVADIQRVISELVK